MATEKPSIVHIRQLRDEGKRFWSGYHTQAGEDLKLHLYGPDFEPKSATGDPYMAIKPSTAHSKVNAVVNHLIANWPEITIDKTVFPVGEQAEADKLEQALHAAWWRATHAAPIPPDLLAGRSAAAMGMGVLYLLVDFSAMPKDEEKPTPLDGNPSAEAKRQYEYQRRLYEWRYKQAFPLRVVSVDPREIILDPGTDGEQWIIRSRKMTIGDVRANFSGWMPPDKQKYQSDFDMVECWEWWHEDYYYYEVDHQPVRLRGLVHEQAASEAAQQGVDEGPEEGPWPNPLGFIPYVPFGSGEGSPVGEPHDRYRSLLTTPRLGNLFLAEAQRHTQIDVIIGKMAWGAMVGPPVEGGEIDLSPGAYTAITPNERGEIPKPELVGFVNPPTGIFAEINRLENLLDRATIPMILETGQSAGSAEAALHYVRSVQEAGVALVPLRTMMGRAIGRIMELMVRFFDNPALFAPNERVSVWGMTPKGPMQAEIGPGIIKGRYIPVFVSIRPALPEDEALRIQTGAALLGRGLSLEMFYDHFMRLDNPEMAVRSFYKDQIVQQVIQSGLPAKYLAAVLSGQANPALGLRQFMAQTIAQQTLTPGGNGAQQPPLGPRAPQAAVEPTPDVRSTGGMATPPGMVDATGNLLRQLLAARAPRR